MVLTDEKTCDDETKRYWHKSYHALTEENRTQWVDAMGPPDMIPAYSTGAIKSRLVDTLIAGHNDVWLSKEELRKIICK